MEPNTNFFSFFKSNIYIAPLQGSLLRGALCTGLYDDVKCRYERIFSVSAKTKHSKLKESPKFPADRWFRVSLPGCVDRVERSQTRDAADEQSLTVEDDTVDRRSTGSSPRRKAFIVA